METEKISHQFIISNNTHGTGCTLSTAFAAFLSLGADYRAAFHQSIDFMEKTMKRSASGQIVKNTGGKGGLLHSKLDL